MTVECSTRYENFYDASRLLIVLQFSHVSIFKNAAMLFAEADVSVTNTVQHFLHCSEIQCRLHAVVYLTQTPQSAIKYQQAAL